MYKALTVFFALIPIGVVGPVGCGDSQEMPATDLTAFPVVLEVGKPMTNETADLAYPGFSAYLSSLQAPSEQPLINRVREECPWQEYSPAQPGEEAREWSVVNTLDWGPYGVVLLSGGRMPHQVILDIDNGRHHLLLLDTMSDLGGSIEVVQVAGQSVLAYHAGMSGTGHWSIDGYFVLDAQEVPTLVAVDDTVQDALDTILPDGLRVTKGGGFDLRQLRFIHLVWKPDDGNSNPTGGRVRIDFDLVGHELVPKRCRYDPDS